jgi:DNA-binding transcriptional ArsR family regulator
LSIPTILARPLASVEGRPGRADVPVTDPCIRPKSEITYNQMVVNELTDADVDRIFQAMADATRRDIVTRTLRGGESVSQLARHYAMSFAAVQKHVAVLERALLVTKERHGREQLVHGNPETLRKAARLLDDYEQIWRGRSERIAGILSQPDSSSQPDSPSKKGSRS